MSKEIKEMMRIMSHQTENISKEVNFIKQSQNQIEILENNLRKKFTRRAQQQKERFSNWKIGPVLGAKRKMK